MKFTDFEYCRPNIKEYEKTFMGLLNDFEKSETFEEESKALHQLNDLRSEFATLYKIAYVKYTADTTNKEVKDEYEHFMDIVPQYDNLMSLFNKALINSTFRKELEAKWGKHLFDLAQLELKTFSPEIMEDLDKEMHISTKYTTLLSSAKIFFEGEERNLNGMAVFEETEDRETRKKATEAKWKFYSDNAEELDNIFDELVHLRDHMGKNLGYKNFTELGYARMKRADYTPEMVARFRKQVEDHIVPVATKLRKRQAERIGLDHLKFYDEKFEFSTGNPHPKGDSEWIIKNAQKMYHELSPETGEFFDYMLEKELMDLVDKKGKAGGGYCTYFTKYKAPFIFSNFNGTSHDVKVLTHEAGHAFQKYCSKDYEVPEYHSPSAETAEIHSMSMEFLTWPWMELFFKEDTDKFKYEHLSGAILFLPYGVAVDEFQHFVYENPDVSPEERKKAWRDIEKRYLPHRDYEGNEFLEKGGFWQCQRHIYKYPFYYIDYTLAQVCAFQFWKRANENPEEAWENYMTLCKKGGSESFLKVISSVGLHSPFEEGCLENIVADVENFLNSIDDKAL